MKKTLLTALMFVFVAGFAYAADPAAVPAGPVKQEMKKEKKEGPCKEDRAKFCADVKKGKGRIKNCLKAHKDELTPACQQKLEKAEKRHNK